VLDGSVAVAELAASLADIDRLNSWFGGYALSLSAIRRLATDVPRDRPLRVIDVGGGTAAFAPPRRIRRSCWSEATRPRCPAASGRSTSSPAPSRFITSSRLRPPRAFARWRRQRGSPWS